MTRNPPKDPEGIAELGADAEAAVDAFLKRPDLIERSEHFNGMKISVNGAVANATRKANSVDAWGIKEVARLYHEGRQAWLTGDLETVANMFGILV